MCVFCLMSSQDEGVYVIKGQRILGKASSVWTVFRVIEFTVP